MKRKHKKYSKPKKPYDRIRIEEEAKIIKEFGLKNKREIWKAEAKINSIREKTKKLLLAPEEERISFFKRLKKIGLNVNSISDVLSLDKRDFLNRRLQTIVFKKRLAPTIKAARQLIVHKKILVDGRIVDRPSYIVPLDLEDKIERKDKKRKDLEENQKFKEEILAK
ncbi:MAG: 30S ribosomal protein S4 [Candidatus Pacearchaeota archaeon]|nr:MAG: 30S ribosomal protein S4 [Candidatus Pacearchaeota archaeon]